MLGGGGVASLRNDPQGKGYAFTPGIHSQAQIDGWRLVTDAVHEAGGRIILQLWHVGRISRPELQPDGAQPVAPSAIKPAGAMTFISADSGMVDVLEPRALRADEIPGLVEQYRQGAENAKIAGFDGVEIHAANGYLLDQFLRSKSNQRTDDYGGSVENRLRFPMMVVEAVVDVWGGDRTGIRVSPLGLGTVKIGRNEWLAEKRSSLQASMRKRRLAEGGRPQAAGPASPRPPCRQQPVHDTRGAPGSAASAASWPRSASRAAASSYTRSNTSAQKSVRRSMPKILIKPTAWYTISKGWPATLRPQTCRRPR